MQQVSGWGMNSTGCYSIILIIQGRKQRARIGLEIFLEVMHLISGRAGTVSLIN